MGCKVRIEQENGMKRRGKLPEEASRIQNARSLPVCLQGVLDAPVSTHTEFIGCPIASVPKYRDISRLFVTSRTAPEALGS